MARPAADSGRGGSVNRSGGGALTTAKLLALLVPAALLAGAYGSQYLGGLNPCEMCYWQRYPHMVAIGFAAAAFLLRGMPDRGRSFVWLAALAILVSGGIGVYHAGVEAGIFQGFTQCTASSGGGSVDDMLRDLMSRPMTRCDEIQFQFLGISMAGWNAIVSIAAALLIGWLSLKRPRNPALA
jgi:disulfide bond formation protein DsbB